ncbi:AroM family protein [Marinactinospora rubrisoli]|uniref:AroM family protein n=1 Tax=Marinactinospora rubrisoli TaxID=2715399 RepID=A0ABW2KMS1_9ACTN
MAKLGVVTIGQSPRDDIVPDLTALLPPSTDVIEAGALDPLTGAEIAALAPSGDPGDEELASRLRDGTEVALSHRRLLPHLRAALERVRDAGAERALLLCTGGFPDLAAPLPTLTAGQLLFGTVQAVAAGRTLLVVCPLASQCAELTRYWQAVAARVEVTAASPYGTVADFTAAAAELRGRLPPGEDAIGLLDCVGYDLAHRRLLADALGLPVLVPRLAMGHLLAQLMPSAS